MSKNRSYILVVLAVVASLSLLSRACAAAPSHGTPPEIGGDGSANRILVIDGVIQGNRLVPLAQALLSSEAGSTVDIVISSPGGEVGAGLAFIDRLETAKANGVTVRCFVADVAASMAFQILVHCSERYTTVRSFLLWHRARIMSSGQPMTEPQLVQLGYELAQLDTLILSEVEQSMPGVSRGVIRYHFENETLHTGLALSILAPEFMHIYNSIPGVLEILALSRLPRGGIYPLSDNRKATYRDGQLIYQTRKVVGY